MKLFYDDNFNDLSYEVEMNESTGSKNYVIKGVFSTPEMRNRNGRIYGKQLWEDNVRTYQNELKNNTDNTLMEAEHPPRSSVDKWKAVAKIRKLEMKPDGKVYGEAVILNNNSAESNQIKALIEAGVPIGVSSRGVGKLGKGNIVEEFKLITYDIVSSPSDYNALTQGFNESMILEGKDFKIAEDGRVICDESGCKFQEGTGTRDISQDSLCESKAKKLIKALSQTRKCTESDKSLTEKLIEGKTEKEIEILIGLGLIEASEYSKLKSQEPSEEEKEKEKEKFRKEQDKKSEPEDSDDSEDSEKKEKDKDEK